MYESLHNHTVASDGSQTYLEVLQVAEELGFGTVAFTDHDTLPDDDALRQLAFYDGPVKWLLVTQKYCRAVALREGFDPVNWLFSTSNHARSVSRLSDGIEPDNWLLNAKKSCKVGIPPRKGIAPDS